MHKYHMSGVKRKEERETEEEEGGHSLRPGYRATAGLPYHVGVPIASCQRRHRQGFVMLLISADLKSSGCGIKGLLLSFTIQGSKQGLISSRGHPPFLSDLYPWLSSTRMQAPQQLALGHNVTWYGKRSCPRTC